MKKHLLAFIAFARFFGWRWLLVVPSLAALVVSARFAYEDHRELKKLRETYSNAKVVQVSDEHGRKLGSVLVPQQAGDFWVAPTAVSPFAIKDGAGVTRDTFETAHGVIQTGGGGTDAKAILGPYTGFETTNAALWILPNATARSATNFAVQGNGNALVVNTAVGPIQFELGGNTLLGGFGAGSGAAMLWVGGAAQTTANYTIFSDGASGTTINTPSATSLLTIANGSAPNAAFAGGTQGGTVLGSVLASAGHLRTPSGWIWEARNSPNSGDNIVIRDDASNDLQIGGQTWTFASVQSGGILQLVSANNSIQAVSGGAAAATITAFGSGNSFGTTTTGNTLVGTLQVTTRTVATTPFTIDTTTTDNILVVDTSTGAITVTLPTPTNGRELRIIDKANSFGTFNLTLARHATEKINGVAASKVISASGYRGTIVSDGTDWYTFNVSGAKPAAGSGAILVLGLLALRRRRAHNDTEALKEAA